jgi:hypothetical protein
VIEGKNKPWETAILYVVKSQDPTLIKTLFIHVQCIIPLQNIRVMAKYYTRIRMKRMGELLDLTEAVSLMFALIIYFSLLIMI